MRIVKKIIRLAEPIIQRIAAKLTQIKTILLYRLLFGEIGRRSVIYKPLRLVNTHNVFVGDHVHIYKQARIETIETWGKVSFSPKIEIGNRVSFEQRLHLICAKLIEIGDGTVVSADVMISDNNHSYSTINTNVMCQPLEVAETIIGRYCFIGMGARIMAGTRLGNNCIVGSNSVVIGDFPDYTVLAGAPARIIKRYDFEKNGWRKTNFKGEFLDEL